MPFNTDLSLFCKFSISESSVAYKKQSVSALNLKSGLCHIKRLMNRNNEWIISFKTIANQLGEP